MTTSDSIADIVNRLDRATVEWHGGGLVTLTFPNSRTKPTLLPSQLRLHYLTCINRARLDGFNGLAEALYDLYLIAFPKEAKK